MKIEVIAINDWQIDQSKKTGTVIIRVFDNKESPSRKEREVVWENIKGKEHLRVKSDDPLDSVDAKSRQFSFIPENSSYSLKKVIPLENGYYNILFKYFPLVA